MNVTIFRLVLSMITVVGTFAGCSSCPSCSSSGIVSAKMVDGLTIETFISDLEVPWAFEFAPDGRLFITERAGRLRVYENNALKKDPLFVFADVDHSSEGGLMGMTLHPNFAQNHLLYVCYTKKGSSDAEVVIKRYRVSETSLSDELILLDKIPSARFHVGCRLKFGPDKKLYVTTGDATEKKLAQDLGSLAGKTLRLNDDGSVPTDNPFIDVENARKEIWALGHRNAQGLDFQPGTGVMFQTEHGPSGFDGPGGGDEVNVVNRGANLGWPVVHHTENREGLIGPIREYTPAIAPAGASFVHNKNHPWYGNFIFAALKGEMLVRLILDKTVVVQEEHLVKNQFGRIRHIAEGPDGALYFSTSNRDGRGNPHDHDDRIVRIQNVARDRN